MTWSVCIFEQRRSNLGSISDSMLLTDRPRQQQGVCDTLTTCMLTKKTLIQKDTVSQTAREHELQILPQPDINFWRLAASHIQLSLFRNTPEGFCRLTVRLTSWAVSEKWNGTGHDDLPWSCCCWWWYTERIQSCFSISQSDGKYFSNWVTKVTR